MASIINAAFNRRPLRTDCRAAGSGSPLDGREALSIADPNVGALPWEAVVKFREHAR